MPGLGHKSYVQFGGKETTYGTFVAPTKKLEVVSFNVSPTVGVIQDASLYGGQSRRALYQGGLNYKGTFTVRLNYEGLEQLFRAAFGSYTNTVVSGVVADHIFREGSALDKYSMEVVVGDVPTGKCFRLTGVKVTGLTIKGSAGTGNDAMLMADFTIVARDMESNQNLTAATTVATISSLTISGSTLTRASGSFVTDGVTAGMTITSANVPVGTVVSTVSALSITMTNPGTNGSGLSASFSNMQAPALLPVLYHQATIADDGTTDVAADVRIRSFEVSLENPHAEDRFYIGALNVDEPLRSDFLTARWKFTQEFNTRVAFDAARAFTNGSPQLLFRNSSVDLSGSGHYREFELRSNAANVVEFGAPVDGYGIIIASTTWEAYYNATDATALLARFRNSIPNTNPSLT